MLDKFTDYGKLIFHPHHCYQALSRYSKFTKENDQSDFCCLNCRAVLSYYTVVWYFQCSEISTMQVYHATYQCHLLTKSNLSFIVAEEKTLTGTYFMFQKLKEQLLLGIQPIVRSNAVLTSRIGRIFFKILQKIYEVRLWQVKPIFCFKDLRER